MCGNNIKCGCTDSGHSEHPMFRDHELRLGGFLVPCILLLLKKQPAHGYELVEKLTELPFISSVPDPAVIYRHLRRLKDEEIVEARLEEGKGGPARKIYSLTPEGESYLKGWVNVIKDKKSSFESFIELYEKHYQDADKSGGDED